MSFSMTSFPVRQTLRRFVAPSDANATNSGHTTARQASDGFGKMPRFGLALLVTLTLLNSGCATWNKMIGKKDEPSPKLNLAWAKLKESEGNLTEARHGYEEVLSKDTKNVDAILGMARLNLKAKRMPEAEEGFKQALALKPHSTEVLSEIGNFYSDQQRWEEAIPLLQECQRLEPHEKNYQFNLAVALAKSGRIDQATPHFREAVGDAAAHYNIGRIMVENGKRVEAEEQFVIALSKDPNLTDAQYFLDEIRAGSSGRAQQVPVVANGAFRRNPTQQVAGTSMNNPPQIEQQQEVNPFEEAPTAGYSQSNIPANGPMNSSQGGRSKPIPSGRQPMYEHSGYEELEPPAEYAEAPLDGSSASTTSQASDIMLVSAEIPAEATPEVPARASVDSQLPPPRPRTAPGLIPPNHRIR